MEPSNTATMADPVVIRRFVLAGDAVLTLQSDKTGDHFTYRVRQAKAEDGVKPQRWYVEVLTGHDTFSYLGVIGPMARALTFKHTAKSKIAATAKSYLGFAFFWRYIESSTMAPQMTVRHEGRCGRCARPLTHPQSIDLGIGPDCAEKMGLICN